jgi:hypothetical protein
MPEIRSQVQLQVVMNGLIAQILDEVTKELLDKLKEIIQEVVYDHNNPINAYQRSSETENFKNSWIRDNAVQIGNSVETKIYQDPMLMALDSNNFIHGSFGDDIRKDLAEVLNMGLTGPYWDDKTNQEPPLWWKLPRPFWEKFREHFEENARPMLIKAFAEKGLKVI